MIYISMLKTRLEELRVAREMQFRFSDSIIPMFEIINELYRPVYKRNGFGEYIYEQRKIRKVKVKDNPTENDIITLQRINECV